VIIPIPLSTPAPRFAIDAHVHFFPVPF
jgi:hypothetical protein